MTDARGFRATARRQRYAKCERLRKRREFLAVQNGGQKIHLKHVLAFVRPMRREAQCAEAGAGTLQGRRLGVTVSSKVGNAVVRNRIKRLVREVWRRNKECFPVGFDVVIVAKRNAVQTTFAELQEQLRDLGRRLARSAS